MSQGRDRERLLSVLKAEWTNQNAAYQGTFVQGLSPAPTLEELRPATPGTSNILPPGGLPMPEERVIRRFKPPFDVSTKHDARGDALSICYDILIQRRVPIWAAHLIAYSFVDREDIQEKFQVMNYKPSEDEYERFSAFSWCRDLIAHFNSYVVDLAIEKYPVPDKPLYCDQWPISFSATKNRKPKMEDRHIIVPSFACIEPKATYNRLDDAFFAVFDGHNGHEVAAYLASHFHRFFLEPCNDSPDPMERLKKTYDYTDKMLNLRCQKENYKGGSTAAGVLINERTLYMFWCGDASIGILNARTVRTLSKRHVPMNEPEYDRVIAAGGTIVDVHGELRVNGVLNITRSMGEKYHKPAVSSMPDMDMRMLLSNDWLLFIASDGVWDELTAFDVCFYCTKFAKEYSSENYVHLADYIVAGCRHTGSRDNLTLIIVFLQPINEVWTHLKSFVAS